MWRDDTGVVQVLIIQFGGHFFYTYKLTLEQWTWCIFFGLGVLLWGQVIVCKSRRFWLGNPT